jgi:hypothetical protein
MTDGRTKGKVAEREVVGIIQAWWRQLEPKSVFLRTPMSGGWQFGNARENFKTAADIMTDSQYFPFSVEVKRREGFAWKNFVSGKQSPVMNWWAQAREQARESKRVAMLWFRKSHMPWHILLPEAYCVQLWDKERNIGQPPKLTAPVWEFAIWDNALCFQAETLLKHPPRYFLERPIF